MSSINISSAREIYGGKTEIETLVNMAQKSGYYRIYKYANDYGDKIKHTNYKQISVPEDEKALFSSNLVHNVVLVYDNGRVLKTRCFQGKTEEEAREAAINSGISQDAVKIEMIPPMQLSVTAEGKTAQEALDASAKLVPDEAIEVGITAIVRKGDASIIRIQAWSSENARDNAMTQLSSGVIIEGLDQIVPPQGGIFGIGKKPGEWNVHWYLPFVAKSVYKTLYKVEVRYWEKP